MSDGRRLVIVSNRLPRIESSAGAGRPEPLAGGLVTALLGVLSRSPGSLWFGWSGRIADPSRPASITRQLLDGVELIGSPLSRQEFDRFYLGYCNETLWPLLHCFQGRVRIDLEQEKSYREVQARFASVMRPHLRDGDMIWIHDYHLFPLGRELRRLGWRGPLGFFLHTPFPPYEHWQLLPDPRDALDACLAYDVVGFQVQRYLDNYVYACLKELRARQEGSVLIAGGHVQRVGVYPVGIEPAEFLPGRRTSGTTERARDLIPTLRDRRLILGVDRLDYTKGIPERILAFEQFLRTCPEWRKKVVYVQIASPSRADVPEYGRQKRRLDAIIGRVNGEMGEHDWTPIRYLYRSYPQEFLAELYRDADVMLVTPLRDGMNLVAKEFVASQDRESPGVLVLSRFTGAAENLREAIIVNPIVLSDVADGIRTALSMTISERRKRHAALLARVLMAKSSDWGKGFVDDLEAVQPTLPARIRPASDTRPRPLVSL